MTGPGMQRVRAALEEHGWRPRGGINLRARCGVHESRGATLAISQGRAGAVIKCHAGCETEDILAALGLDWPDLYDEPRDRADRSWKPLLRPLTPAERVGRVLARAVVILATAEAMRHSAALRPRLTPEERVEHAEWACRVEADRHYWRTLARWAALACDEVYVRRAHKARQAWLDQDGDKPAHEQFMVLLFRAEDVQRGIPEPAPEAVTASVPATAPPLSAWKRMRGILGRVLAAEGESERRRMLAWGAARAGELVAAGNLDAAAAEQALRVVSADLGLDGEDAEQAIMAGFRRAGVMADATR